MTTDERKMLDELMDDDSDRLSDWEIDFCESMNKRTKEMTDGQREKLTAIWEKVFKCES